MGIYLCSAIPKVEGVRVIGLWNLNSCNGGILATRELANASYGRAFALITAQIGAWLGKQSSVSIVLTNRS